jgi:hypothetical protein
MRKVKRETARKPSIGSELRMRRLLAHEDFGWGF